MKFSQNIRRVKLIHFRYFKYLESFETQIKVVIIANRTLYYLKNLHGFLVILQFLVILGTIQENFGKKL